MLLVWIFLSLVGLYWIGLTVLAAMALMAILFVSDEPMYGGALKPSPTGHTLELIL